MKLQRKWIIRGSLVLALFILAALAFVFMEAFNVFHAHEHCMKQTAVAFRVYSGDHEGKLPYDTNGFGNALLLLVKSGCLGDTDGVYSVSLITAPGDNGDVFRQALKTGAPIPEDKCSRIYIQGLSETNNPELTILFDKYPTPGGDHFRRPWGRLLRDVCFLDGSAQIIAETNWPAFSSNQVELLVKDGFSRTDAKRYYQIR